MRILQVSSASVLGGGEDHVIDLCLALLERGHQVDLAVRPASPLVRKLSQAPITFHRLPLRNSLDIISACRLARIIRRREIDVIHGHVARDYLVCAAAQWLSGRARLVLTRHHYLPIGRNWAYRQLMRRASKIIAVSNSLRRGLISSAALPPDQVVTIPNWVEAHACSSVSDHYQARAELGLDNQFWVGMVGQVTPAKGQEEFVRAAALVGASRDDVGFLLVGEEHGTDKRFTQRLRELVCEQGVGDRVKFIRRIENMHTFMAALTVFVLPSWQEAFSIVLIQAMSAGLPVIASRVGGPADIVTHGVTGLLVPPRDVRSLAEAVNKLLDAPDMRAKLGAAARREVQRRFAREKVVDQIESLYKRELHWGEAR